MAAVDDLVRFAGVCIDIMSPVCWRDLLHRPHTATSTVPRIEYTRLATPCHEQTTHCDKQLQP